MRDLTIGSQRPNCFAARSDSLPAGFEGNVQPDSETIVLPDQFSIPFDGPGAAAERDDTSISVLENVVQGLRLDLSKHTFTFLSNDFGGATSAGLSDKRIQIDHFAGEVVGQRLRDRGLATTHETYDDDATIHLKSVSIAARLRTSGGGEAATKKARL